MEIINFNPEKESEEQYIYRICSMKQSSGMTWQQIADIINTALDQNFGESAYRKKYQMFQQGLKACENRFSLIMNISRRFRDKLMNFIRQKNNFKIKEENIISC